MKRLFLLPLLALFAAGCVSFTNDAHKSIYVAATMADGGMKAAGVWYKDQVVKQGHTPQLEQTRTNLEAISFKVGTSLAVADRALSTYEGKVGTNTTTKAVVTALIQTAVQSAGEFEAQIGILTGNTNLISH